MLSAIQLAFGACPSVMVSPVQISTGEGTVFVGSTITLSVISDNPDVISLSREVLREFGLSEAPLEFGLGSDAETIPNSEVCLLDWEHYQLAPRTAADAAGSFISSPPLK